MASFPSPGRPSLRRRDEQGGAFPSPLVMRSVIAGAMASITFVATRDESSPEPSGWELLSAWLATIVAAPRTGKVDDGSASS